MGPTAACHYRSGATLARVRRRNQAGFGANIVGFIRTSPPAEFGSEPYRFWRKTDAGSFKLRHRAGFRVGRPGAGAKQTGFGLRFDLNSLIAVWPKAPKVEAGSLSAERLPLNNAGLIRSLPRFLRSPVDVACAACYRNAPPPSPTCEREREADADQH